MPKTVFRVAGSYRVVHHVQPFTVEVAAASDADARERVLSQIGSRHGVPRRLIRLGDVTPLAPEDVEDGAVRRQAGL